MDIGRVVMLINFVTGARAWIALLAGVMMAGLLLPKGWKVMLAGGACAGGSAGLVLQALYVWWHKPGGPQTLPSDYMGYWIGFGAAAILPTWVLLWLIWRELRKK